MIVDIQGNLTETGSGLSESPITRDELFERECDCGCADRNEDYEYDQEPCEDCYYYPRNDWFYDVEFVTDMFGSMKNVRLMVAGGGPTIWWDLKNERKELYWWGSEQTCNLVFEDSEMLDDLWSYFEDMKYNL